MDGTSTIGPVLWNRECCYLIHKAVLQQNHGRIEKLLSISPYSLETKTNDKFKLTPLLVAASFGCVDTFHFLLELKAKADAKSARDCNAVQCALIQRQVKLVVTLLDHPSFTVFKDVSKLISGDFLHIWELSNVLDVFHHIINIHVTGNKTEETKKLYEKQMEEADAISKLAKLTEDCLSDIKMMRSVGLILIKIVEAMSYSNYLFPLILKSHIIGFQLKLSDKLASSEAVFCLLQITSTMMRRGYSQELMALHAPKTCLAVTRATKDDKIMLHTVSCMKRCSKDIKMVQHFHADGMLQEFADMIVESSPSIQSLLLDIFSNVASIDENYRQVVLELKAVQKVLEILDKRQCTINYEIISLLYNLCQQKGDAENIIKESEEATSILLHMIKYSISAINQRKAFEILWLVAAEDAEEKRALARLVGPSSLITMLSIALGSQQVTATTALSLLAPPVYGLQKEIRDNGGVPLLLKVVQTSDSLLVKQKALQVLENCCHDIALRPNKDIQRAIVKENGINIMMKVMICATGTPVHLQTMCTLAAASIGSTKTKCMIFNDPSFSLYNLLTFFCELDPQGNIDTILTAARTLTFLTYFHPEAQGFVANTRRICLKPLQHLVHTAETETKIEAAFYTIALAPIFDKSINKVEILCTSIRYLVNALHTALNEDQEKTMTQLCTYISGLLPMSRFEGLRQAFVSLDVVSPLVKVIYRDSEHCKMTSAIALNYITKDPNGCRVILAYCRRNKDLFEKITHYSKGFNLDHHFVSRWNHYKKNFLQHHIQTEIEDPCGSELPPIAVPQGETRRMEVKLMELDPTLKLPHIINTSSKKE